MQRLNTVYLNIPGSYLHLDNDTLRQDVAHETRLRVPLHHLQAVVCFGRSGGSASLLHWLADRAIALALLDDNGRFKARLKGFTAGNVLLRRAQHLRAMDSAFALVTARAGAEFDGSVPALRRPAGPVAGQPRARGHRRLGHPDGWRGRVDT